MLRNLGSFFVRNRDRIIFFLFFFACFTSKALAQDLDGAEYDDTRIQQAVITLLTYLEGSFGALVMVCAGIGAILASAFGQYRASLGCLVVAVGSFILKSLIITFLNAPWIDDY